MTPGPMNATDRAPYDSLRRRTYSTLYLGDRIARGLESARERDLSVTFADIRGYTERSIAWPPGQMIEYLEAFYAMATKAARDTDGFIDKFMGDGVMTLHGLRLREGQDLCCHPVQAVTCALQLLSAAETFNHGRRRERQIHLRAGIASGKLTAGVFKNEERLIFTALGVRVNMAARLQQQAEPGSFLAAHELAERLERDFQSPFRFTACGKFTLKGFDGEVVACKLERLEARSPS